MRITLLWLTLMTILPGILSENMNHYHIPFLSKIYRKLNKHNWMTFIYRLTFQCLKKYYSNLNLVDLQRKTLLCINLKIIITNCHGNIEDSLSNKYIVKPFGYLCGKGGQGNIGMKRFIHKFDFGSEHNALNNVIQIGSKEWYLILSGNSLLGLNITFLSFHLVNIDPGYFPLFYRAVIVSGNGLQRQPSFLTCKLEFVYLDFYKHKDFRFSYYHSFGPYCGYRSPWSLFSTANTKIYFRTFENSQSHFNIHYQAIDLGYIMTRSVIHENAVWIENRIEEHVMNIHVTREYDDYIRSEDIHGAWRYRFVSFKR